MKEARPLEADELRPCDCCGGPVAGRLRDGALALDLYRLQLDRLLLDRQGTQQLLGLEQFFGGAVPGARALANVFASRPVAQPISTQTMLVCQHCWLHRPLAEIAEAARERQERAEERDTQADGVRR